MKRRTLQALRGSIEKWEGVVAGDTTDLGSDNCPLCQMFQNDEEDRPESSVCKGCPVKEKTGHSMCGGSPYKDWIRVEPGFHEKYNHTDASLKAATAELEFLRSLLPERTS